MLVTATFSRGSKEIMQSLLRMCKLQIGIWISMLSFRYKGLPRTSQKAFALANMATPIKVTALVLDKVETDL